MSNMHETDPQIADLIRQEEIRQASTLELIASENHVSKAVMEAAGSCLANKYAEGYAGARYYGGGGGRRQEGQTGSEGAGEGQSSGICATDADVLARDRPVAHV